MKVNLTGLINLAGCFLGLAFLSACGRPARFEDRIKVAAIYPGPRVEPPAAVLHQALDRADRELEIAYEFTENVPPRELERVIRDYVEKGYELIFGDDRGAEGIVRRVARDHPEVAFCFHSRLGSVEPNLSVFSYWVHEPAYLCGRLAGRLTTSGLLGAAARGPHPALNAVLNAFREGVLDANPDARVEVAWGDTPESVERETEGLIDRGADYVYAADPAAIGVCRERRVPAFGHLRNWYSLAPDTMVTGAVWDLEPTVAELVEDVEKGRVRARDLREWSMMAKGGAYLAPYHAFEARIPFGLREEIEDFRRDILSGMYRVPVDETLPLSD